MNIHTEQKTDVSPMDAREFFAIFERMEFEPINQVILERLNYEVNQWKRKNGLEIFSLYIGNRIEEPSIIDVHPNNIGSQLILYALIQLANK